MDTDARLLREFGEDIQRLIDGGGLTRRRSYEMFRDVLLGRQPELQQGAFLAALVAKGETPEEIAGAWEAIAEIDTVHTTASFDGPVVENSGTGMDQMRTFNASSAAAVVAAANGVRMGRHAARGLTSPCGAIDILEAVGVDVDCGIDVVERSMAQAGIGVFNGMSAKVHPKALARILGRIRFGSTLNIAASLANPCRPSHGVRGVYSEGLVPMVCTVMKEIGYARAVVVHGFDADRRRGLDEISVLGETVVAEFFPDGRERTMTIAPEELGLTRAHCDEIAQMGDMRKEAVRFVQVLAGRGHRACVDFTCANGAAILYLIGQVESIGDGIETCRETMASGKALRKLAEWVDVQQGDSGAGPARLERLLATADVAIA